MIFLENLVQLDKLESIFFSFFILKNKKKIKRGISGDKKGTAFVVYDDIFDAKNAFDHLSGFNVAGRFFDFFFFTIDY